MPIARALLLFILLSGECVWAQLKAQNIVLKGQVVDSAGNSPLSFVTLTLMDPRTSKTMKSLFTKNDGSFELRVIAGMTFELTLVHMGYLSKTIKIPPTVGAKDSILNIGKIVMVTSAQQLNDVVITGTRAVIKQEIDRVTYKVQADPESKANDALEMLRKVPMVTVDGNDVIQLKGSSNFQIFINGKPSALMTNSPADVLKSMPAATILKIEVITVPPSKYDAEGLAGIINIITLEKIENGFSGSIFGRWNSVFGERGSLSFSLKEGRFGLNSLFGLGYQPLKTSAGGSQLINFSPPSDLSQTGQNVNGANFNNGQTTLSYELDTLQLLTASVDFFNRVNTRNSFRSVQLWSPPDSLVQSYPLNNIGKNLVGAFDIALNYQLSFAGRKDELLTLSYQYTSAFSNQDNLVIASNGLDYVGSTFDQQNNTNSKSQTFQLDFVKPVRAWIIEAGSKAIFRTNSSLFGDQNLDSITSQYIVDTILTNQFEYHQNVYSIYNSYQFNLSNWIFKGGLRLENTRIYSNYPVNQNYLNLVPDVSIQRNFQTTGSFTQGFTERIQRPFAQQLNPFVDRSNPEFITTGNPGLQPVVNHIIELRYSESAKAPFNVSLNYSFSDNNIQNVTSLISDTVSETTYLNVGKTQSAGINLSTNYPITNRLNVNINGQLFRLWITGTYNSQFYQNQGYQGNANAFVRYNFGHDLNVALNFGYFSGGIFLQGKSSDYKFTSVNIIKEFFKKKAVFSLTLYDPLEKFNNYISETNTPGFQQTLNSQYYYRNLRLAFNYKFGRLNSTIKTNSRGIKNEDPAPAVNREAQ